MKHSILIGSIVSLVVAGGAAAYYYASAQSARDVRTLETIAYKDITAKVSISGTTKAAAVVDLAFKNGGIVNTVPVRVNDAVATGTVLVALRSATLSDQLAGAQAALVVEQERLHLLEDGTRSEQLAVTQARLTSGETSLVSASQELRNALNTAQGTTDVAVRVTIDQFITNPMMVNSTFTIPVNDSQLGSNVLSERRQINDKLGSWGARLAAARTASSSELVSVSVDMHAYVQTIARILDGLTQILAKNDSMQFAASQATVAATRASVASANDLLAVADRNVANAQAEIFVVQQQLTLEKAGSTNAAISAQRAVLDGARARVGELEDEIKDQSITAPWSGIVSAVHAKSGETIVAGDPMVSLISKGALEIEGYVPEIHYAGIAVGQPVAITLDAFPGGSFAGVLGRIDPVATLQDGVPNFKVTVYFTTQDPQLKPGLSAKASIQTAHKPHVLVVSSWAITRTEAGTFVTRVSNNVPVATQVTLGIRDAVGDVEIISGLSDGDTVLVDETKQYQIVPN